MPSITFSSPALLLAVVLGVVAGLVLGIRQGRSGVLWLVMLGLGPAVAGAAEVASSGSIWLTGTLIYCLNAVVGAIPPTTLFAVALSGTLMVCCFVRALIPVRKVA